jgi:probable phosphoglycerate mutase
VKTEKGESPLELQQKQQKFIQYLRQQPYSKVLICMHGRAMRIILCTLLKKPLQQMDEFPHHNVCLYKVKDDGNDFSIELFNDLNHLNGAH